MSPCRGARLPPWLAHPAQSPWFWFRQHVRRSHHERVWSLLLWQLLTGRGSLGRAGPAGGRVQKALIHHPEADLLAGVHVQVVCAFLCLVLPHPHLLCVVAGWDTDQGNNPAQQSTSGLEVPHSTHPPGKSNHRLKSLRLGSHRKSWPCPMCKR